MNRLLEILITPLRSRGVRQQAGLLLVAILSAWGLDLTPEQFEAICNLAGLLGLGGLLKLGIEDKAKIDNGVHPANRAP